LELGMGTEHDLTLLSFLLVALAVCTQYGRSRGLSSN
jgi:hypothetical protein